MNKYSVVFFIIFISLVQDAKSGFGPNNQKWGYVTVREKAHMFWWLHYTTASQDYTKLPLVIWLQGGPGSSSTGIGNFHEIGPWDVNQKMRNLSWVEYLNVLFVDNPVGTGYSYVDNSTDMSLFAQNNTVIAEDFIALIRDFFNRNAEFRAVPLYIFGQSYGGKMAVDITLKLHEEIQQGNIYCQLKGIGLGDAWISPLNSLVSWPEYLLNLGFIDTEGFELLKIVTDTAKAEIGSGNYNRATGYFHATQIVINRLTNVDYYNVLSPISSTNQLKDIKWNPSEKDQTDEAMKILEELGINLEEVGRTREIPEQEKEADDLFNLMNGPVKQSLQLDKIPIKWGEQSDRVFKAVNMDFMKPVTEGIEKLLNETDIEVTVYNGQLDLIVSTPGTINWINNLKWKGAEDWKKANRTPIEINGINEGHVKKHGNFNFFWINRAGHVVPSDNPHTMKYVLSVSTNNSTI